VDSPSAPEFADYHRPWNIYGLQPGRRLHDRGSVSKAERNAEVVQLYKLCFEQHSAGRSIANRLECLLGYLIASPLILALGGYSFGTTKSEHAQPGFVPEIAGPTVPIPWMILAFLIICFGQWPISEPTCLARIFACLIEPIYTYSHPSTSEIRSNNVEPTASHDWKKDTRASK
jgi:hypothetical protein